MTIYPEPTLYLNFPEKKSWADIMEEEEGFSITYNQPRVSSFEVKKQL